MDKLRKLFSRNTVRAHIQKFQRVRRKYMPDGGWDLDRVLWEVKLNRRKKGKRNCTQDRVCLTPCWEYGAHMAARMILSEKTIIILRK